MSLFRFFFKLVSITLLIVVFFITALLVNLIFAFSDTTKKRWLTKLNAFYCRICLWILGFHLKIKGEIPKSGSLIIGNHMSYLDILIYLSFFETLFVTSVEMKERFFIGQITTLAGCLFVERRNPRKLHEEMINIKHYFNKGFNVCIFPEGTSSNGETVLPFKKSLFQIPFETKVPLQPIILKYQTIDSEPFSSKNCDKVCWYGDLGFFKHLFTLLTLKRIEASLEILDPINPSSFTDRKALAEHSHRIVLEQYQTY